MLVIQLRRDLFSDLFKSARLRITLLYAATGMAIVIVAHFLSQETIEHGVSISGVVISQPLNQVLNDNYATFLGWVVYFLFFIIGGYFISEIVLRPIKNAHDDQRRFTANVSHELRTPLSILKTNAEVALLKGKELTHDDAIEVIQSNIEEVNRMSKIIQFFLNFSTMENKIDRIQMTYVNLSAVSSKAVNILQKRANDKGISLELTDRGTTTIYGNATALEEMLLNLIKNAIAYTPKGGRIEVALRHTADHTILSIHDTGSGISAGDLPHIFEPFFKGGGGPPKKDGVGLGLAIVKRIAHMHRATIDVKSRVGKGTTFSIQFPIVL